MNNWQYRDALIRDDGTVLIIEEDTASNNGNDYRILEESIGTATTVPDGVGQEQQR